MRRLAAALSLTAGAVGAQAAPAASWQRGATCYEVFVRSFADSDGDGIGDLRGPHRAARLHQRRRPASDATTWAPRCIWLMPVAESPGYHGYDVSRLLSRRAGLRHQRRLQGAWCARPTQRGIRVLVDMVLNHTVQRASVLPGGTPRHRVAVPRLVFPLVADAAATDNRGANNWHKSPLRDEYYYAFFWQGMPDLNYEQAGRRSPR